MNLQKVQVVLDYAHRILSLQEDEIRGRYILNFDALKTVTDQLNIVFEAEEQLENAITEFKRLEDTQNMALPLAVNMVIEANERGEIPTFNDQNLRSYLENTNV